MIYFMEINKRIKLNIKDKKSHPDLHQDGSIFFNFMI